MGEAIVDKLNADVVRALDSSDVKELDLRFLTGAQVRLSPPSHFVWPFYPRANDERNQLRVILGKYTNGVQSTAVFIKDCGAVSPSRSVIEPCLWSWSPENGNISNTAGDYRLFRTESG